MRIIISNSSSTPIYEQIKRQIIDEILTHELNEGDIIPSIRSLASDIKISVMTIKKAYDELEKEGYIKSVQGKGTFVMPQNMELFKEQANKDIESYLYKIVEISKKFDISKEEILDLFEFIYRGDDNWKMW